MIIINRSSSHVYANLLIIQWLYYATPSETQKILADKFFGYSIIIPVNKGKNQTPKLRIKAQPEGKN
jgi:hypothetical protein